MDASKTASKGTKGITASTITKKVPHVSTEPNPRDPKKLSPEERALAGTYRVIHGTLHVPRPVESFTNPDGTEIPGAAKFDEAQVGDEVRLTDKDAAHCLDAGVIERLDTKPSQAGKVCKPPKPALEFNRPRNGTGTTVPSFGVSSSQP